jgi:hypothetical protein
MTQIDPIGSRPTTRVTAPRAAAARAGSRVAEDGGPGPEQTSTAPPATAGAVSIVSLQIMLAEEALDQAMARDRAARRQGQAVLRTLATLQHTLLSGADPGETLTQLAVLLADQPRAQDPRLAGALDSIVLRARVELARYRRDAGTTESK